MAVKQTGKKPGKKARVGDGTPGPGRPKGSTNKATTDVRKAIALFAEKNVSKLQVWIEEIAKKDPKAAADLFVRVIEYHIPKLARKEVEHSGRIEGSLLNILD